MPCAILEKVRQFYIYISICIYIHLYYFMGFPSGSVIKNPSAMKETQVQSLGQEDPLEEELATQSSILVGKSHGQRGWRATVHEVVKELDTI